MPYCVVTAAGVAGGEQEEVRIFYQRYGHGATKVLLIIGTTFFSPFLMSLLVFSSIELNPCVQFRATVDGTEIFRTDRFRFLHYDIVFYIIKPFLNFVKHKTLSVSVGFTTIFVYFLYFLIAKI